VSWPQKASITQGVVDMLRVNVGLQAGEKLLVVTDVPRVQDWQSQGQTDLEDMLERAVLARLVADIAAESCPDCSVQFHPFPSGGLHGSEPDRATAQRMKRADVVIALTTCSLSHTSARQEATKAGGRVASMPVFEARLFKAGGPMAVDHQQMAAACQAFAGRLTAADSVILLTPYGTDLRFSLKGRPGQVDTGLYTEAGLWGNLPGGEAYAVPLEGTAEGQLVVPAGWYPRLAEDLVLRFEKGGVVEVLGGGAVGEEFRRAFNPRSDDRVFRTRRNLAELGIGTNPNARKPDNVLEAEKIKGTVHIGIGDNLHIGGRVEADLHDDFVQPKPDLFLDGKPVIVGGEWKIE